MNWLRRALRWYLTPAIIHYSLNEEYYYIEWAPKRQTRTRSIGEYGTQSVTIQQRVPHHWLTVKKYPGPVPDKNKNDPWRLFAEIHKHDTNEVYYRIGLGFVWFDVKSGKSQPIDKKTDLFKDYVVVEDWEL